MKFSINLDIDISEEELDYLKSKFLPDRVKICNVTFDKIGKKDYQIVYSLSKKLLVLIDNIGNYSPTEIGNKILDSFDRDIKINNLLDGQDIIGDSY